MRSITLGALALLAGCTPADRHPVRATLAFGPDDDVDTGLYAPATLEAVPGDAGSGGSGSAPCARGSWAAGDGELDDLVVACLPGNRFWSMFPPTTGCWDGTLAVKLTRDGGEHATVSTSWLPARRGAARTCAEPALTGVCDAIVASGTGTTWVCDGMFDYRDPTDTDSDVGDFHVVFPLTATVEPS